MSRSRRTLPALAAVALLLLAGCAASPTEPDAAPGATRELRCLPPGSASASVEVADGAVGEDPAITVPAGITVTASERTVLVEGTGAEVVAGDRLRVAMAIHRGSDGSELDSFGFDAESGLQYFPLAHGSALPGFVDALACLRIGTRAVAVLSPQDAFGASGQPEIGIGPNESMVLVFEVVGKEATRADGEPQAPVPGLPTVVLADDGAPTVTIPEGAPPAGLQVAVLQRGAGAVVSADDALMLHYQGVIWRTGQVFDQSWGRGVATFRLAQLVAGFTQGVAGQTVGSQLLIVIPPELGYGPQGGNANVGIEADDTIVFVVDVLDIL